MAAERRRSTEAGSRPRGTAGASRAQLVRDLEEQWCGFSSALSRFQTRSAAQRGLSMSDLQAIEVLSHGDPVCASELAEQCGLTRAAITGMLNRLERAGVAHRSRDDGDARRLVIRAVEPRPGADCRLPPGLRAVAASFSPSELRAIRRFLSESAAALSREADTLSQRPSRHRR